MTSRGILIRVSLVLLTGALAFIGTRVVAGRGPGGPAVSGNPTTKPVATSALFDWLDVPQARRAEITAHDPSFPEDLQKLRSTLTDARASLASALEDTTTTDQVLRQKVEAVITASNALERRVASYLILARDHLTAEQQKKLFGLCAEGVRQGRGWRWRQGGGGQGGGPGGGGQGPGRGFGPGGGAGLGPPAGNGPRRGQGFGPGPRRGNQ